MSEIVIVAAVARNGVIGRDNALVFDAAADRKHFRELTMGCPVVMGRKTWDSLPARFRPLPGRRNLVLTRDDGWSAPGAEPAASLHDALRRVADSPRVCVIGGAQVYAAALPLADVLELTEVDADLVGDVRFPDWRPSDFARVADSAMQIGESGLPFRFVTWRRR